MPKKAQHERADIYIVHTELEWVVAKAMARALDACGYVVAPTKTLELPDRPVVNCLPADAAAVIVIWPIAPTEFGMPALELEARAAAERGNLVQVFAGVARPHDTYRGPPAVDFTAWDHDARSRQFRSLLRRIGPLCGGPRTRPRDEVEDTQKLVLLGTLGVTLAAIFFALGQSSHHDQQASAPQPPLTPDATEPPHVALSAAAAKGKRAQDIAFAAGPAPTENVGGPENGYDKDLGVDPADTRVPSPPAPPAPPPAPARRPVQGPDQF